MKILHVALCVGTCVGSACGETWRTTKRACEDWDKDKKDYHNLEECLVDGFTLDPVGPTAGSIGSGSSFAAGLRFVHSYNRGRFQSNVTVRGMYSLKNFYLFDGVYTMTMPPVGHWQTIARNSTKFVDDDNAQVKLEASRVDLRSQDFYGLGPASTLAGHAVYRQQEDSVGADAYTPVSSWAGVNGGLHYLSPAIKGVTGDAFPSEITVYGEAGAPASTTRPDFVQVAVGGSLRTPTFKTKMPWESHHARVLYEHFSQVGASQYSFGRLSASASLGALLKKKLAFDFERPWWKDALCQQGNDLHCTLGTFTVTGLVTASYTGPQSTVPFYLQPTLGGTDVAGVDTLRGLVDYRLRAPNRVLVQAQFDKPVSGPLGLYAFFDAGQVEAKPGQLSLGNLRTDVGVGATLSVQRKIVVRLYIGFGAGEGSHPNAKLPSAF
jgi:hypothetical protein